MRVEKEREVREGFNGQLLFCLVYNYLRKREDGLCSRGRIIGSKKARGTEKARNPDRALVDVENAPLFLLLRTFWAVTREM